MTTQRTVIHDAKYVCHPPRLQYYWYRMKSNTIVQVSIYDILVQWILCQMHLWAHKYRVNRSLNLVVWFWRHWNFVTSPKSRLMPRLGSVDLRHQGLYSPSDETSYRQISWSFEAARLGVIMIASLWNLTGISTALLSKPGSRGFETSRDLAGVPNKRVLGRISSVWAISWLGIARKCKYTFMLSKQTM